MPGFNDGFFDERSSFDPSDITIDDNTAPAFLIREGSNEYMRIDTTNGSELTQFKMPFTTGEFKLIQETSAGPYPFIKCDATSARLFPGADGTGFNFNRVEVTTSHVHLTAGSEIRIGASLPVSGSGARVFPLAGQSWTELLNTGSTSKIQRVSDGLKLLEVDTDGNSTFTLEDSAGGIFKVQDDAGTPTEFLKIDSTTGARRAELKTGYSSQYVIFSQSGNYAQFRNGPFNQVYLYGQDIMELYGKFCTHRQYSNGYFRSLNASGTIQLFAVEENSNTTFRLNTATPGVFKVQDHGTTNDFIKIDSDPTAALIEFNVPANQGAGMTVNLPADSGSNTGFQVLAPSGHLKFGRQATGIYTGGTAFQVDAGTTNFSLQGNQCQLTSAGPDIVMNLNAGSVNYKVTDAGDADILKIEENAAITTYSNQFTFRNAAANSMAQFTDNRLGFNGGGAFKHIEIYGAPSTQNASHAYGNRLLNINNTFKFGSAGTAPATISASWYTTRSNNTSAIATQYVTLHNLNATHNAIFQFPVRSGYGTAVAMDSDATDFLNASGSFTLTPGQAAVMEITTYNALGTEAGLRHYVRTIGKG